MLAPNDSMLAQPHSSGGKQLTIVFWASLHPELSSLSRHQNRWPTGS